MSNEALLRAEGLSKVFQSGEETLRILDDVDLELAAGESLAVLGASGSGKSTLLYLLGALDRPSAGRVFFEGRDIFEEKDAAAWRNRSVGFVFQFHHLLSDFSALENVAMPARLAGLDEKSALKKAEPLLERVGLAERLHHRPGALSGGEQQRVALARALVMEPKILLADEPTGNLDGRNSVAVNSLILELVAEKKLTAVVVTHNRELAAFMSRRLELKGGRLENAAD